MPFNAQNLSDEEIISEYEKFLDGTIEYKPYKEAIEVEIERRKINIHKEITDKKFYDLIRLETNMDLLVIGMKCNDTDIEKLVEQVNMLVENFKFESFINSRIMIGSRIKNKYYKLLLHENFGVK